MQAGGPSWMVMGDGCVKSSAWVTRPVQMGDGRGTGCKAKMNGCWQRVVQRGAWGCGLS